MKTDPITGEPIPTTRADIRARLDDIETRLAGRAGLSTPAAFDALVAIVFEVMLVAREEGFGERSDDRTKEIIEGRP